MPKILTGVSVPVVDEKILDGKLEGSFLNPQMEIVNSQYLVGVRIIRGVGISTRVRK